MDTHSCNDLLKAASEGHEACVRKLLAAGADPNIANNYGNTPLHGAAHTVHEACVATLLAAGADPNVVNVNGDTPLLEATMRGHEACVATLIAAGANPNVVNTDGKTLLHSAVCSGHEACVRALIDTGADLNAVDDYGKTLLQLAVEKGRKKCAHTLVIRMLADRALTGDEWDIVPPDSDIGYLLPVVMTRDGRDASAKLVSKLPAVKRKVLETAAMCLSRVVLRDVAEQIMVRCV